MNTAGTNRPRRVPRPFRHLKVLYLALNDPETPAAARVVAWLTIAYALSPIDLIPDFIPVLGHLDDVILIPLGILLVRKLIPPEVWERNLRRVEEAELPERSLSGILLVILFWVAAAVVLAGAAFCIYTLARSQ